jgi:bifunctional autolysin
MKKLILSILCTVLASGIVCFNSMYKSQSNEKSEEQLKQETKIEKVDEKIETDDTAVMNEEIQETNEEENSNTTAKNDKTETKSNSTQKGSSSVSKVPKQETSQNTESSSKSNETKQQQSQSTKQTEQSSSNSQNNNSRQKNNVSTSFYDSITGGKKEFSSESTCFARGTQIQNAELDYVLDYNEQHPEAPIQPEINYFRCYPVIDEQGEGWYLHFFCRSGEGLDSTLKSKY